jgi:hypothetical protein
VYGYLQKMKFNEPVEIEFLPNEIIPSPIAKAFFVDIVKDFIDNRNGDHLGFRIEFSNDFQRIKKFKVWPRQEPVQNLQGGDSTHPNPINDKTPIKP